MKILQTRYLLPVAAAAALATTAQAQVIYSGGNYTQNFNWSTGGNGTGSATWANNAASQLVPGGVTWTGNSTGWYAGNGTADSTSIRYGNGVQTTNTSLINNLFFTSGETDRILGGRPSGAGPLVLALRLTNNTGSTLTSFDLSYELEVAGTRTQVPTRGVHSTVGYFLGNPTYWGNATATGISGLSIDFYPSVYATTNGTFSPVNNPSDPNPGNYTASASVSNQAFSWANGQDLWIRWTITGDNADFNVGIDNVSFVAVPEPTTWALLAAGLSALVIFRRRRND
jgi:hypothetical protein